MVRRLWRVACFAVVALGAAPLGAEVLGPDAEACRTGLTPAFLVRVSGLANRQGTVRVRLFGGDPATYFDRKHVLVRTQIPTPPGEVIDICVPAPGPGIYAIDVRHDVNGNDSTDRGDGGGISGNPRLSMWDVILRRRPSPDITQVTARRGVTIVPIRVRYL